VSRFDGQGTNVWIGARRTQALTLFCLERPWVRGIVLRMSGLFVEQARVSDWARTRTIRLRALTDAPDAYDSTLERELAFGDEEWKQRLARTDAATFIASVDQTDVGIVVVAATDACNAGLYAVWVAPEARGTGAGNALMKASLAWACAQGFERVTLGVGDFNTAAIGLYERHGFVPTGETSTLPPPRTHITEHTRALTLKR
jgi:ribosomal protein S18 acetylase RimI-like enzyme